MECGCKQETTSIVLEGEYGADPLWCAVCQYNLDLDEIALSSDLINELYNWAGSFGEWVDIELNEFVEDGEKLEASHNARGKELASKVNAELGAKYKVTFRTSEM